MSSSYNAIGFIGLGTMGYPMLENLIKKLHPSISIYVYDVAKDAVDRIVAANKDRVFPCADSKGVTEKSVGNIGLYTTRNITNMLGHHFFHGP